MLASERNATAARRRRGVVERQFFDVLAGRQIFASPRQMSNTRTKNDEARACPPPEPMEEDDEEATPFPADPQMAATTAPPPPFGDADYVIALQWEGTYLGWLNDTLLGKIFGSLQMINALEWARLRYTVDEDDGKWSSHRLSANHISSRRTGDHLHGQRYWIPIKANRPPLECDDRLCDRWFIYKRQLSATYVAKYRGSTNPKRHKRYRRFKREAFVYIQWFLDVLMLSRGMDALPCLLHRRHVDYAEIADSCGGGSRTYDWEKRSKWPGRDLVKLERLGFSFELPQHRYLGDTGTYYNTDAFSGIDMRGIYKTEGRARTTDLLDAGDIAILFHNRAVEWGRTYAQSWQAKRANGTLHGYQTTDGRAFDNATDADRHQRKLNRLAKQ
jgi:hypothetical protein